MEKLKLDLEVLLPGVPDRNDACVDRIHKQLSLLKGVNEIHVEQDSERAIVCLHYDPSLVTLATLRRLTGQAGARISNRYQHELLALTGMDCSDCTLTIEHAMQRLEGVLNATVNYAAGTLRIEYDSSKVSRSAFLTRLNALGYGVRKEGMAAFFEQRRELIFAMTAGLLVAAGWLAGQAAPVVSAIFYLGAYYFGGWDVSRHAWSSLRQRQVDTDLLMVVAALGAAAIGDLADGALLLFLFGLGHALEEMALDRAREAVHKLGKLTPKTALVRRNGQVIEVNVEQLELKDVVIVRPGARLPVDGIILSGASGIDQSPITGESIPVNRSKGDKVFAGTVNGEEALEIRVSRLAKDNTLARVMQLVEEAQSQKTRTQQITERFTAWFVPAVLIGDILFFLMELAIGVPANAAFLRAMTLLVAASPCALALAAPSAILTAIACAGSNGVLIKGGAHLETLGKIDLIAFDKTGTLTHGQPEVVDIVISNGLSADELLSIAAGVESRSGHPIAQAIVRAASKKELGVPAVATVQSLTGQGLRASINGKNVLIGNFKFVSESGITSDEALQKRVGEMEGEGKTCVLVALENRVVGAIALADTPRPQAKEALSELKRLGIKKTLLLTGDNQRVAANMAQTLGLDQFLGELLPEDKVKAVREFAAGQTVAMVGDGVNDAPALAVASVGIAMGGAATDVALETADVALMSDDLSMLPFVMGLGRATRRIVLQNLFVSGAVILVLLTCSIFGITSIALTVLVHEGSTLAVVANALRLLKYARKDSWKSKVQGLLFREGGHTAV